MANIIEQIVRIVTDGDETRAEVIGELVLCKDCKWYEGGICYLDVHEDDPRRIPEAYCSVAERRDDD